jgi:CHAT domain-containing protein/tetratricopeptide (TPR) repeat protein
VIAKVEWHPGELYPRVGFIVTNMSRPAERVVAFYNKRGTAEQWIREGKGAIKWTRLSCRTFAANAVRLQLHALAYNLGNFLRTLATPEPMKDWSLSSLKEKLIKIGAKVISHGRTIAFQMAEVAIPRANVPRDFAADCRAAADAAARAGMRRPMVMRSRALDGRTTPRCHRKPDSSDAVTSLPGRMESDRRSTGTRLLRSAKIVIIRIKFSVHPGNPGLRGLSGKCQRKSLLATAKTGRFNSGGWGKPIMPGTFIGRAAGFAVVAYAAAHLWCSTASARSDDCDALNERASELYQAGKYAEAMPLAKHCADVAKSRYGSQAWQYANALNNLALLLMQTNRLSEAEPLMRRALAIDEKRVGPNHPDVARKLTSLAQLLEAANRLSEAEPLYRRALAIDENSLGPDHTDVATSLGKLAELLRATNRLTEAEPLMRRALAINEKSLGPDHPKVAVDLTNLALLLKTTNRLTEAEPLYRRALAINEKSLGPDHPEVATDLNNLAFLFGERGDWASAVAQFRRASDIITRQGATPPEDRTGLAKQVLTRNQYRLGYHVLALYHSAAGEPEAGEESFRVGQWALQTEAAEALRQMSTRFAAGQGELASLVREQQDLLRDRKAADARLLAAVRAANAQATADGGAGYAAYSKIEARLDAVASRLRRDFREYAAVSNPQPLTIAATQALLRPDEALVQFLGVPSWGQQHEETFAWVVSNTGFRWIRIDLGPDALAKRVQALRCGLDYDGAWRTGSLCSDLLKVAYTDVDNAIGKPLPFDLARANELYKALFGQIEDLIKDKQLLIVASGPLTQLPFQVLVTEPPKTPLPDSVAGYRDVAWLARQHAITVLPSVASLQALRAFAKVSHASEAYIGFGDPLLEGDSKDDTATAKLAREKRCEPTLHQRVASIAALRSGTSPIGQSAGGLADVDDIRRWPPLPETADELCDVAQDLGVDPATHVYLGAKSTEAEVKRLSADGTLEKYRIVHFATHGVLAGQLSGASDPGLILTPPRTASETDDGYLTASEITGLKLDADWVILSACNTAAGGEEGADALSGLARAFFYAGARSLLVSNWSVYSDATVKLITKAISELKSDGKIGRAEALRRSMVALITDGQTDEAHPAFWAPFVLVGEGAR